MPLLTFHIGSRDSVVNLVNDIYGYEDRYNVFPKDTVEVVKNIVYEGNADISDSLLSDRARNINFEVELFIRRHNTPEVVFRTISKTSYSFMYEADLVWIKFKDGSRIIYSNR